MIREISQNSDSSGDDRTRTDRKVLREKVESLSRRVQHTADLKAKVESRLLRAASRFRELRRLYSRQLKELHQVEEALRFHSKR